MQEHKNGAIAADTGDAIRARAAHLHAIGISTIPLWRVPGEIDKSKRPAIRQWKPFITQRPNLAEISEWFAGADRNLGVITGACSNLVVIDTDTEAAEEWAQANLPVTPWMVKTGKGWHRYFRHPGSAVSNAVNGVWPKSGIDIRGDGGYVVGPGSLHGDGHVYLPENWPWQITDDLPTFDSAWLALSQPSLAVVKYAASAKSARSASAENSAKSANAGFGFEKLSRKTAEFLTNGASEGERNQRLFLAACDCHGNGIPLSEAEPKLLAAAATCNPPMNKSAARQTIASAYSQPRQPARKGISNAKASTKISAKPSAKTKSARAVGKRRTQSAANDAVNTRADSAHAETNLPAGLPAILPAEDLPISDAADRKPSMQTRAVELVKSLGAEFWHDRTCEAFVTLPIADHREHFAVRSAAFDSWLAKAMYDTFEMVPNQEAVRSAIKVMEATAKFDGPQFRTAVRIGAAETGTRETVAGKTGAVWLDLGLPDWSAVKITAGKWEIFTDPEFRFHRPQTLRPLPLPMRGGSLATLRQFINITDDEWPLLLGWLVGVFAPAGPFPILVVNGEHGSAKTTACEVLQRLADPHSAGLRAEPTDTTDLMIAAMHCHVLAYDNISHIPEKLSDAFCRLATGGSVTGRKLFTNSEETVLTAQRPLILNGITDFVRHADLLSRTIRLNLPALTHRRTIRDFWADFETEYPRLLGALLDAVATALANVSSMHLDEFRMADFAAWAAAAEPALPIAPGSFLAAYKANTAAEHDLVLDGSMVAPVLLNFMHDHATGTWSGTASELLAVLNREAGDEICRRQGWPRQHNILSNHLKRISETLRSRGLLAQSVTTGSGAAKRKIWRLHLIAPTPSAE